MHDPLPVHELNGTQVHVAYGSGVVLLLREGSGMVFDLDQARELRDKLDRALALADGAAGGTSRGAPPPAAETVPTSPHSDADYPEGVQCRCPKIPGHPCTHVRSVTDPQSLPDMPC